MTQEDQMEIAKKWNRSQKGTMSFSNSLWESATAEMDRAENSQGSAVCR